MTARGIRNNNPGNIILSGIEWQGERPSDDSKFEQFDTPENGIRALCTLLLRYRDKHGLNTIRGILYRWAPPSDNNDTPGYVAHVSTLLGIGPDEQLVLDDPEQLAGLATAIIAHENGEQPYHPGTILAAARAALGKPAAQINAGEAQSPADIATPQPEASVAPGPVLPPSRTQPPKGAPMAPAIVVALLQLAGGLIPEVGKLFPKKSEVAERNLALAGVVADGLVRAVAAATPDKPPPENLQAAVEALEDPQVREAAREKLNADPLVASVFEIGTGGIAAARAAFAPATVDGRPWWTFLSSAPFWIALSLVPLLYGAMVAVLFPALVGEAPSSEQLKTLVVTAIFSGIAGAICGFFFGAAYTAQRTIRTTQQVA